ncbi:MAG TPA: endonuclease/exonuclease/phosphatase family protein [Pyrinomonadaceae bacterium]|nr:endonuclease/exonuclease/phosphatase family protein [Pyrinomonadaceae bacterium]
MSLTTILLVIGILTIAMTALPLIRKDSWWIRIFDFPRIQVTVVSAIVLPAYLLFEDDFSGGGYFFIGALVLCVFNQGYMMFPYTPLSRKQVRRSPNPAKDSSIRLLFANVLMYNRNSSELKKIIRENDPDIILTVETDDWWMRQLREFELTHSHTIQQPQENTYGMLFYSRLEIENPEIRFLIQDDIPSIHARVKLPSGQAIELHCLHPRPPFPTEDASSTERDAELLLVGKEIKDKKLPVVVMGDLNDVAWSRTNYLFQDISGLLDPRIGRGFYNTFHAKFPFIRFPLDHFFHSNHFRLIEFKKLRYFGSDHFPVYIALSLEPEDRAEQEELQVDQTQEKEAAEKIEKAL